MANVSIKYADQSAMQKLAELILAYYKTGGNIQSATASKPGLVKAGYGLNAGTGGNLEVALKQNGGLAFSDGEIEVSGTFVNGLIDTAVSTKKLQSLSDVQALIASAVDTIMDDKDASTKLNSFKEIADWIDTHGVEAAAMLQSINSHTADLSGLHETVSQISESNGELHNLATAASSQAGKNKSAIEALQQKVETLEGVSHTAISATEVEAAWTEAKKSA